VAAILEDSELRLPVMSSRFSPALLLLVPWLGSAGFCSTPCGSCHPREVKGYSRSAMSHSLRAAGREPEGSLQHSFSSTKFSIFSKDGLCQRMEREGVASEYRVDYVIGSGKHASGYLVRIGDHLFQSPLCYYTRLGRYDMAPGYEENRAPDFIRAVTMECLLCHSGRPRHIEGTLNEYRSPGFDEQSISCDRCHGDPARHLKAPLPGTIVNPASLPTAARNSICEQCHLKGAVRVLNPGRRFEDFRPGEPLETVFTIYTVAVPPGSPRDAFKVISHSEQLALSLCARRSNNRLWCGTCHNPHDEPERAVEHYQASMPLMPPRGPLEVTSWRLGRQLHRLPHGEAQRQRRRPHGFHGSSHCPASGARAGERNFCDRRTRSMAGARARPA